MKRALLLLTAAAVFAQQQPANLPAQKIGVNDLIAINVYRSPELSTTARVDTDGAISLPLLQERIPATGIFPRELETRIAAALKSEGLLVNPLVTVTIAEYYSRPISVAGAVEKPVTFQATGEVSLLEAITRAEGLTSEAGEEILVSFDGSGEVRHIPVKALLDGTDPSLNLALAGGEQIRVPEAGKIYVVGNVQRPGAFVVRDSTEPTVLKMLALAEGLAPFASKQAWIYHGGLETPVDLDKILKRKSPDVTLAAGDIFYVPDNQGKRIGLAALEKVLLFGSTAGATALVWRR